MLIRSDSAVLTIFLSSQTKTSFAESETTLWGVVRDDAEGVEEQIDTGKEHAEIGVGDSGTGIGFHSGT